MSYDRIPDIYERRAENFDKERDRSLYERPWLQRFLAYVPAGARVLDLGCGMGEPIAKHIVTSCRSVTGVDSSLSMIKMARERFPEHEWIVADMRLLALRRRFGGIIAWDSFFHLCAEDQRAMFGLFAEHCEDGAPLMFTSGPSHGEAIGTYHGEPLYHASLDPGEYEQLLKQNGFEVRHYIAEDPECSGHTVWLATYSGLSTAPAPEGV